VLTALVASADTDTHLRAISALGDLGQEKAEGLLSSLLEVGSDDEYQAAAKALAQLSPETTLAKLRVALRSTNDQRRTTALSAILGSQLPGVTPLLVEALHGDDVALVREAVQYLARKPDAALEPDLTALLDSDDRQIQRSVLRALSRLHTPSALETLKKLADSDTLGTFARNELDRLPGAPEEIRARRIREVEHGGTTGLAALAADTSVAAQAAVLSYFSGSDADISELPHVVQRASPSTVEQLVRSVTTAGPTKERALIAGLVLRGDPRFVDVLRTAARESPHDTDDEATRTLALRGLVQLGDGETTPLLEDLAKANEPSARALAAELLGQRPDADALPLLEALAADPDASVVSAALSQLETRAPDRAVTLARRAYDAAAADDRPSLLSSLGSFRSGLAMPLYDLALRDEDENVVVNGLRMLGGTQSPESAARLLAVAADGNRSQDVRAEAARALRGLGGPLVRANGALLDQLDPQSEREAFTCNAR
jgi:HEAT repeat protein